MISLLEDHPHLAGPAVAGDTTCVQMAVTQQLMPQYGGPRQYSKHIPFPATADHATTQRMHQIQTCFNGTRGTRDGQALLAVKRHESLYHCRFTKA